MDARDVYRYTPLHTAAWDSSPDTAAVLLDHGADVDARSENGDTPLHMAVVNNNAKMAEFLKQHGGVE